MGSDSITAATPGVLRNAAACSGVAFTMIEFSIV
jgi:hypothetical protein